MKVGKIDKEENAILEYKSGAWEDGERIAAYSMSETITVALAINRYDLLPENWSDPLEAYRSRLDDRQRSIVDLYRGVSELYSLSFTHKYLENHRPYPSNVATLATCSLSREVGRNLVLMGYF